MPNFLQILINKQIFKYLFIFGGYVLFCALIYNKGLDLTDNGYHLANQMNAQKLGLNYIAFIPTFWLSDYFAAQISNLFGGWTLIEMRMFVLSLGFLQILILLKILKDKNLELNYPVTFLIFLIGLFMTIPLGFVLLSADYYTIPTFFSYVIFFGLISFFYKPTIVKSALLAGLCFMMLNLRLSAGIIISLIPILIMLFQYITKKEYASKKEITWFYALVMAFLVGEYVYFLSQKDVNKTILLGDWHNETTHHLSSILLSNLKQYLAELGKAKWLLAGFLIYILYCLGSLIATKTNLKFFKNTFLEKLNILPYCLSLAWIGMLAIYQYEYINIPNIISLSYSFYIFIFIFLWIRESDFLIRNASLIISSGIIPIAIFIGTNTGIQKIGYGLPILIFTIYFMLSDLSKNIKKPLLFLFFIFYFTYLGGIILKGQNQYYENIQVSQVTELTYKMRNGKIKGTYTRPNSGKAIDELLFQIEKHTKKGDKIFAFLAIPLIYYASDRENVIDDMLNFDVIQSPRILEKKLTKLCSNQVYTPKILVKSKKVVYDTNWQSNLQVAKPIPENNSWNERDNSIMINKIVEDNCKPKVIWENEYFQILVPQK